MQSKKMYKLSILLYLMSLALPMNGMWFGGLFMMLTSGLVSVAAIGSIGIEAASTPKGALGMLIFLLPFANIVFIWCALKFKSTHRLFTLSTVLLFASTLI
ncbi:hypothetical protein [Microbulbifer magnicolonia]|uniref:hypothetical protein n=1 Tax=Microbulbifer magnicolonia TaxID=3109744 RepID=UPI002B412AD0|nr:hypothetical protein [Microbulbifer sp. GG15]